MRLFLLGDFISDNGPGNANKRIRDSLKERLDISYSQKEKKFERIIEAFVGITKADVLIICSKSQINYPAIIWAKLLRKKSLYILHGLSSYEEKINNPDISENSLRKMRRYERFVFDNVDKIVCVSKLAMHFLIEKFPMYTNKVDYIYNVVDFKAIQRSSEKSVHLRIDHSVMSVGGGMRQKNNLAVARALSAGIEDGMKVALTVVGKDSVDGDAIKKYPFVTWIDNLPHDKLCQLMRETKIYIQNSTFETFGLAIIEALYSGCDILISANVGCKDLFTTLDDDDVIFDVNDTKEISSKVSKLLKHGNNQRLRRGFSENFVSADWQCNKIMEIIYGLE